MSSFYFERECRTPNSECYTILEDGNPIGRLDLHFTATIVHATLVVGERLTQEAIQDLITIVDEDLIDAVGIERDEFVVHVHQGRDLGVWSNNEPGPTEDTGQATEGA
jgi:hypothetical protein